MGRATIDFTHVQIVCDEPSHAPKQAKFHSFVKVDGEWIQYRSRRTESPYREDTLTPLQRINHSCKLCGLSFTATDETLRRLLDMLAGRGVTEISLRGLNYLIG